jgi:regulator of protease activity HflC (stomatin/prohibitin superfamily)
MLPPAFGVINFHQPAANRHFVEIVLRIELMGKEDRAPMARSSLREIVGSIPIKRSEQQGQRLKAAPKRFCEDWRNRFSHRREAIFCFEFSVRKGKILMNFTIDFHFIAVFSGIIAGAIFAKSFRHVFFITEGYAGLLYHKARFIELLRAGQHIRWGRHFSLTTHDLRKGSLLVAGQEVVTADSVNLKLTAQVTYQMVDPASAIHETQNWQSDLYNATQLALRSVVGRITTEAILARRQDTGPDLLSIVKPLLSKIGLSVLAIELKDATMPAELKRAFVDVLKARQEGQAALERARGESAALRNLANAARMLESNPALMNLRLMQSLSTAQAAGNTFVLGVPGFVPLKGGKTGSSDSEGERDKED